jgi:flagellar motor switch protein FliN/FliY
MLDDVQLDVQIELGRADLLIDEVLAMREGMVVPLDKLAGDPIDIVVNGRLLGRGEVLVLNDNFCVRVVEIVAAST